MKVVNLLWLMSEVSVRDMGWSLGQRAEFYSDELRQWLPCVVVALDANGQVRDARRRVFQSVLRS